MVQLQMVGDGINDAHCLSANASYGIRKGAGTDLLLGTWPSVPNEEMICSVSLIVLSVVQTRPKKNNHSKNIHFLLLAFILI